MPRKKKTKVEATAETLPAVAIQEAERPTEAPTEAPPTPAVTPEEVKEQGKEKAPDPFRRRSIRLGDTNDSPMLHLWRSYADKCMAISFDEAPEKKYREKLQAAGFSYWAEDKVWKKPFMTFQESQEMSVEERNARRIRVDYEAEKLAVELADEIRADKGLGPAHAVGM